MYESLIDVELFYTMLSGLYIIDGVDIWTTYGAAILKGSYNSLLSYPKRTTPDMEDWFEEYYVDVDYSSLFFDASDVTIRVGIYGISKADLLNKREGLRNLLNQAGNRNIVISGINATIELRYKGGGNLTASPLIAGNQFYLEQDLFFSNDKPTQLLGSGSTFDITFDYTFRGRRIQIDPKPYDYMVWSNFTINGRQVTDYGMGITSFNGSALAFDMLKEPLINKYSNMDGAIPYVLQPLKSQQKKLDIGIVMAHNSTTDMMDNYKALFNELSAKKPIEVLSEATGYKYFGYYSNQNNLNISISPSIKTLEFNLELNITNIDYNG